MHAAVESPELLNVYSGTVVTDAGGAAVVELPEYFEALNTDFRYQLTIIGGFAQAVVSEGDHTRSDFRATSALPVPRSTNTPEIEGVSLLKQRSSRVTQHAKNPYAISRLYHQSPADLPERITS